MIRVAKYPVLFAAFVALAFAVGCAAVEQEKPVVASVCESGKSFADDQADAAKAGYRVVGILKNEEAQDFVAITGGQDAPFFDKIASVFVTITPDDAAAVVGVYDASGCRLGVAVLPRSVVGNHEA